MNVAKIIDQTNIRTEATRKDIVKTCQEALIYGFRGVCVNPEWVKLTSRQLKDSDVKTICLVDPPIGDSAHQKRMAVARKAKKEGADELDVVIPLPDIKHERWGKILKELKEICKLSPTKVIIGSGYLTDEEIGITNEKKAAVAER